jgi:DNA-binding NtrC family response regulator
MAVSFGTTEIAVPKTVLVVDDEPDMLRLVEAILVEQGYEVIVAKGSDTAIRTFERLTRKPDLVLTDVVMPGMSGPMMIDHLLSIEPNLRVLFMSGYDDRQVVQRYVVEKGFALIPKPFTLQRLGSFVKDVLDGRASGVTEGETLIP